MSEVKLSMALPLDSDGFLRRECPTCEREFKWFASSEEDESEADAIPEGGYFCPYCAIQAPPDAWFTRPQIEVAQTMVAREVVDPMMEKFVRDIDRPSSRSGGVSMRALYKSDAAEPQELSEPDDMRRVDFTCHPDEPVKVTDEWAKPAHCLICGQSS